VDKSSEIYAGALALRFLHALGRDADASCWREILTDDAVCNTPSEPDPARPEHFVGREAILDRYFLRRDAMAKLDFLDVEVLKTDKPGTVVVTCRSEGEYLTGGTYANRYAWIFSIQNGKIREFSEFFDPKPVVAARAANS